MVNKAEHPQSLSSPEPLPPKETASSQCPTVPPHDRYLDRCLHPLQRLRQTCILLSARARAPSGRRLRHNLPLRCPVASDNKHQPPTLHHAAIADRVEVCFGCGLTTHGWTTLWIPASPSSSSSAASSSSTWLQSQGLNGCWSRWQRPPNRTLRHFYNTAALIRLWLPIPPLVTTANE